MLHCFCLSTATAFTVHTYSISKRISRRPSLDPASTAVLSVLFFHHSSTLSNLFLLSPDPRFSLLFLLCSVWDFFFTQNLSILFTLRFPLYSECSPSLLFEPFFNDHIHPLLSCAWILINLVRSHMQFQLPGCAHSPW